MRRLTKAEAKQWLTALRSGKFRQGLGQLKREYYNEYQYCCLGVLCEVISYKNGSSGTIGHHVDGDPIYQLLTGDEQGSLIDLNDTDQASFTQIADYIEAEILPNLPDASPST